jgi:hypothetical protein
MIRHSFRCSLVVLVLYVTSLVAVSDVIAQRRGGFSSPPPRPYTPPPRPYTPPPRPVAPPQRSSVPPPRPIQPPPRPAPQKVTTPGTPNRVQPKDPRIVGPAARASQNKAFPNGLRGTFGSAANRTSVSGLRTSVTSTGRTAPVVSSSQQNLIRARLTGLKGKFNKASRLSIREKFRRASGGASGSGGSQGTPPVVGSGESNGPRKPLREIFNPASNPPPDHGDGGSGGNPPPTPVPRPNLPSPAKRGF